MNAAGIWTRRILLSLLFVFAVAWATEYGSQWLLRRRAEKLLADIRSLNVAHSGWPEAQRVMNKWGAWSSAAGSCTAELCNYRVTLAQILPQAMIGYPEKGARNWLPRLINHLGLRSVAVRGGFNMGHGVVTAKWFAEQVTLPVSAWDSSAASLGDAPYIPDLAISSGEFTEYPSYGTEPSSDPYRRLQNWKGPYGITVYTLPQEDASERAALLDFQFSCITRFSPCLSQGEILPEAWNMVQEDERARASR
jgi:hypothetical protein